MALPEAQLPFDEHDFFLCGPPLLVQALNRSTMGRAIYTSAMNGFMPRPSAAQASSVASSTICRRPIALAAHGVVASLALHADGGAVMRHLTLDTTPVRGMNGWMNRKGENFLPRGRHASWVGMLVSLTFAQEQGIKR